MVFRVFQLWLALEKINKMTKTNAQLPAFPDDDYFGLSKREYFIAMALQGVLASDWNTRKDPKPCAKEVIAYADEVLKLLEDK